MKKNPILFLIFCVLLFFSCGTTNKTTTSQNLTKSDINNTLDLTAQLRKLPGLTIRGSGENAIFTVRGISTFISGNQPLFVVDGVALLDYPTVYRMVTPNVFESAKILKNASETSFYGVRGANGVIIIKTKK